MRTPRGIAVAVVSALMLALAVPAFAQPFADVPPNHWAYDAIADLAAKGLIEGYPDGTFNGDRAMTRYEMALVVARLLARIESIQIPAPIPPQVTGADVNAFRAMTAQDLDAIARLVDEFRAELAGLGVRTNAAEEELNAIKARLDHVKITGGLRFREDVPLQNYGTATGHNLTGTAQNIVGGTPNSPGGPVFNLGPVAVNQSVSDVGFGTAQYLENGSSSPFGVDGNPRSAQVSPPETPNGGRPRYLFKLGFDGSIQPDLRYVIGVLSTGAYQIFNSGDIGTAVNAPAFGTQPTTSAFSNGSFGSIDSAFLDWQNAWGLPLEIRLGRFGTNSPCGTTCFPIQWGPFGLIMNDTANTWQDTTNSIAQVNEADGLRINSNIPRAADMHFEFVVLRIQGQTGSVLNASVPAPANAYIFGEDAYGANVNFEIVRGLRAGLDYVGNTITAPNNSVGPGGFGNAGQWHVYGPAGESVAPGLGTAALISGGFHCVSVTNPTGVSGAGIACPAAGNGLDGYVDWAMLPHLTFDGEYAQWNDAVFGTSDDGYKVNLHVDLGGLTGFGHNWTMDAGYMSYGQNFYPPYGAADLDIQENDFFYPGDGRGLTFGMAITLVPRWTLYFNGETGSFNFTGLAQSTYETGVIYDFSQNADIVFKVRQAQIDGVQQQLLYRAQLDYFF